MLGCCSDTLSVMVSFGMYQLPPVVVDPILVCKPLKLVNGHLSTRLETRTKESNHVQANRCKPWLGSKSKSWYPFPVADSLIENEFESECEC